MADEAEVVEVVQSDSSEGSDTECEVSNQFKKACEVLGFHTAELVQARVGAGEGLIRNVVTGMIHFGTPGGDQFAGGRRVLATHVLVEYYRLDEWLQSGRMCKDCMQREPAQK